MPNCYWLVINFFVQNIKIFFEYADFNAKISLILEFGYCKWKLHNPMDVSTCVSKIVEFHGDSCEIQ